MVRGLFDPLMLAATEEGAALDWKTSLQELTAAKGLGVPEYVVGESGPDHQKAFTAAAVVKGAVHGEGAGRSKKEAEQQAAEAAWRDLTASA
jgi:ribonuclease-3